MMLPILISLSVAPGSYFFCAAAGSMLMERPSTIDASRMPQDCAMSTSLNAVGCLPIMQQSRVLALNLSSYCDFRIGTFETCQTSLNVGLEREADIARWRAGRARELLVL